MFEPIKCIQLFPEEINLLLRAMVDHNDFILHHAVNMCLSFFMTLCVMYHQELEKNMELSSGSFQRQLANERRRTHDSQQDVKALQEEVERLCTKLKVPNTVHKPPTNQLDVDSFNHKPIMPCTFFTSYIRRKKRSWMLGTSTLTGW